MAIDDCIKILTERFSGDRCRIIKDQGDYSHIIRIRFPNNDDVQVQVAIPTNANNTRADVFVRGGQPEVRASLERRLHDEAYKIEPADNSDSILALFEFCETLLAEHELLTTQKKTTTKPKNKNAKNNNHNNSLSLEEGSEKKRGMKTAEDVIKRLRWDKSLPAERFSVGYLDRFLGVIEKPFDAFNWEDDLVDAALTDLAIPQHRIQYFKYRAIKVWDKNERLDLVFNSVAADGPTIYQVMNEENEKSGEQMVVVPPNDDDDDGDGDEPETTAMQEDAADEDYNTITACCVENVPKGIRPDYFLSVPIDDQSIRSRVQMVQDSFKTQFPNVIKTLINVDHLHVTLALFCSRDQPAGLDSVISALNAELDSLRLCLSSKCIQFRGLTLLADRVLCSCPGDEFKSAVIEPLKAIFDKYGLKFYASSVPHLTIGKLNLAKDVKNAEAVKNSVSVSRFNGTQALTKFVLRPVGIKTDKEWNFTLED